MPMSCQNHSQKTPLNHPNCILQDKIDCIYERPPKLMNRVGLLVATGLPQNCKVSGCVLQSWESEDGDSNGSKVFFQVTQQVGGRAVT